MGGKEVCEQKIERGHFPKSQRPLPFKEKTILVSELKTGRRSKQWKRKGKNKIISCFIHCALKNLLFHSFSHTAPLPQTPLLFHSLLALSTSKTLLGLLGFSFFIYLGIQSTEKRGFSNGFLFFSASYFCFQSCCQWRR